MLPEPIAVIMHVADALEALGVTYAIGGSFASALHGVMRATMDADLVADLRQEDSDRQWRDALGVLKVQGLRLDLADMRHMAAPLCVEDLLERALEESA